MSNINEKIQKNPLLAWILFFLTIGAVFLVGLLTSSIMERRTEALYIDAPKIPIKELEPRNEFWGQNYPREFQSYYETADTTFASKHNGNKPIDMLDRYPNLVVLWAGYGFSKDYNQGRGHVYAVKDIFNTLRTGAPLGKDDGPMPSTCWTCKSPDVPRVMKEIGIAEFYQGKWGKLGGEVVNPIGCADCHDEKTMDLKITRPALIEAFERQGKDISKSSHQEMRSLVCAQCHVEYYFNKEEPVKGTPYLTFPWDNGTSAEEMEEYYDNIKFSDWTHKLSKAPMLKAQHPGYETFQKGIHAKRGVSCADCHMPYKSEGGVKFTDHKIQSPLNNVANSCQVCHRQSEQDLIQNVYDDMDAVLNARGRLEDQLATLHIEAKFCWDNGATEEQMKDILVDIRHAQWRWDYAAAAHGGAFHAPVELQRVIASGIEIAAEGRLKIAHLAPKLGHNGAIPVPDISTKEKAQSYIGLDMDKLNADKEGFKKNVLPTWLEKAEKRESQWEPVSKNQVLNLK